MTARTIPRPRTAATPAATPTSWCRDAACRVSAAMTNGSRLLSTALREIFDEAAYARFLERTGQDSSRAAYAGFLRERAASQERRARCC